MVTSKPSMLKFLSIVVAANVVFVFGGNARKHYSAYFAFANVSEKLKIE